MSHRSLREIAKFASGLVAADFITLLWMWTQGLFPVDFLGAHFTDSVVWPGLVFDVAVFIVLVHYGWHLGKIPRVKERTYLFIAGIIFTVVAAAHLLRIFTGTELEVLGWQAPLWLSWIGTLVATYLAYSSFVFASRSR